MQHQPETSDGSGTSAGPRNVAVVLLDSLNRHMLGSYGGDEFATPNLDRFAAERATRFTRHVTGSLPCMPARHDILCGALDFLWKPWGSIELWEQPITRVLHEAGITTALVTDHPHLFETGGENYHTDFDGWDYLRGHEGDPWRTHRDPSWVGAPAMPARSSSGPVGGHCLDRVHRSRPLPGRDARGTRRVGQAGRTPVRAARAHTAADPLARPRRRRHHRRADHQRRPVRDHRRCLRGIGRPPHPWAVACPASRGAADRVREWAIGGYYGGWVQITDGRHKYARGAVDRNFPLSMWSNRWSTMPIHLPGIRGLPNPDDRAWLDRMPGSDVPVIRQPFEPGDRLPFWASVGTCVDRHFLFDLDVDPDEQENRSSERHTDEFTHLLRDALVDLDAPDDQLARLGLA